TGKNERRQSNAEKDQFSFHSHVQLIESKTLDRDSEAFLIKPQDIFRDLLSVEVLGVGFPGHPKRQTTDCRGPGGQVRGLENFAVPDCLDALPLRTGKEFLRSVSGTPPNENHIRVPTHNRFHGNFRVQRLNSFGRVYPAYEFGQFMLKTCSSAYSRRLSPKPNDLAPIFRWNLRYFRRRRGKTLFHERQDFPSPVFFLEKPSA